MPTSKFDANSNCRLPAYILSWQIRMYYHDIKKSEERKLWYSFLFFAIVGAIISPLIWILLSFFQFPVLPLPWNYIFRADAIYFYLILLVTIISCLHFFKNDLFPMLKLITIEFYSFPLFSDTMIEITTKTWNFNQKHEFIIFGWQPTIGIYMYLALFSTLISISFIYFDHWWKLILTWTYAWNLWGARPFIYEPLQNILPVEMFGNSISFVALVINIFITSSIIVIALIIRVIENSKKRRKRRIEILIGLKVFNKFFQIFHQVFQVYLLLVVHDLRDSLSTSHPTPEILPQIINR